ncbi:MAG: hypothetical protein WAV16_02490 [Candidatus Moraniibacteriota bacterium]
MADKKLFDPTSQKDWEKFGKEFEADFDNIELGEQPIDKKTLTSEEQVAICDRASEYLNNFFNNADLKSVLEEKIIVTKRKDIRAALTKQVRDKVEKNEDFDIKEMLIAALESSLAKAKSKKVIDALGKMIDVASGKTIETEEEKNIRKAKEEKDKKIKDFNDAIELEKNELAVAERKVANMPDGSRKDKILETILVRREKIEKSEFERDLLEAEDVESIEGIADKNANIKKISKKSAKATIIDLGESFDVIIKNKSVSRGEQIFSDKFRTSQVKNIKKCKDGSYIIETSTSFYRLKVESVLGKGVDANDDKNELTEVEKENAIEFFKKNIIDLATYKIAKESKGDIGDFFKDLFIKKATADNFLDGDIEKIKLAWDLVALDLPAKIEEFEKLLAAEAATKNKKDPLTMEEVYNKLSSGGASDEDINYFFNLKRAERVRILELEGAELALAIKDLSEIREKDAQKRKDFEELDQQLMEKEMIEGTRLKNDDKLKLLGEEVEKNRRTYVEKESSINSGLSKLKSFFKNFISIDNTYQVEQDLELYKNNYQTALKEYLEAIVEIENPADGEDREILFRYAKFSETLNLLSAREDLKFEKHPIFEGAKREFDLGMLKIVDKYKELMGKPRELIMKKTDSKILGLGGGMLAVGGAMALVAAYAPGIRVFTRTLGIALASRAFYQRAEAKAIIEKEESIVDEKMMLEKRLATLEKLGVETNDFFKEELGWASQEVVDSAKKERQAAGKRLVMSIGKAIAVNTIIFELAQFVKGYFPQESASASVSESVSVPNVEAPADISRADSALSPAVETVNVEEGATISNNEAPANIPEDRGGVAPIAGALHPRMVFPVGESSPSGSAPEMNSGKKDIYTLLEEAGIKLKQTVPAEGSAPVRIEVTVPEASVVPSASAEMPVAETPMVEKLNLGANSQGVVELNVLSAGLKDNLREYLIIQHEKLTAGNMGWKTGEDVSAWADRRAIGIIGELKAKYPDYNFDKVASGTKLAIDVNNLADIKVVGFSDAQHLGGNAESITELEKNIEKVKNPVETGVSLEQEKINTVKEISLARELGFKPQEYAEINEISVNQLYELRSTPGDMQNPNVKLQNIFHKLEEQGIVTDKNMVVAEVIRDLNPAVVNEFISNNDLPISDYTSYVNGLIQNEFRLGMSESGANKLFFGLFQIKEGTIAENVNEKTLQLFQEAIKKTGVHVEYDNSSSVKSLVVNTLRQAYEEGRIREFREALRAANLTLENK